MNSSFIFLMISHFTFKTKATLLARPWKTSRVWPLLPLPLLSSWCRRDQGRSWGDVWVHVAHSAHQSEDVAALQESRNWGDPTLGWSKMETRTKEHVSTQKSSYSHIKKVLYILLCISQILFIHVSALSFGFSVQ